MRNTADVTGGKSIAVLLQSISGVSAINPLVAFYDIHGGKREVLFFYFVPDTTRDIWSTASNATHLQFDISANALEIRALQSPMCIIRCAADCTYIFHVYISFK
jgi:hypothetical protein